MNIHYRILKVDPAAHGITVRYFTDRVTEMDLANSLNADGSVILNADGYPLSTRTDVMISIYNTPAPSNEELEKYILMNAPIPWLQLQEDISNPDVDTKMKDAKNLVGESKSLTLDELNELKKSVIQEEKDDRSVERAYETVVNMLDALKVLATEDPQVVRGFFDALEDIKKTAES